jgi:hypothetical protein
MVTEAPCPYLADAGAGTLTQAQCPKSPFCEPLNHCEFHKTGENQEVFMQFKSFCGQISVRHSGLNKMYLDHSGSK